MKNVTKILKPTLLVLLVIFASACNNDDDGPVTPVNDGDDIVELAIANNDLTSLVAALQQAGLVTTLQGAGPFTVFAPTDDAFDTFLEENDYANLAAVPDAVLTAVLLNHVVAGENLSSSLTTGYINSSSPNGPNDEALSLYVNTASGVKINNATVTTADVDASNGVIHIVDQVIGLPDIVDHALFNDSLSDLVEALTAEGNTTFTTLLSDADTDYTVFAPVNSAFEGFESDNDINTILANHVISNAAATAASLENTYFNTAAINADGDLLSIYVNTDDGVRLNGTSTVLIADIVATNGIIHAVDEVIDLPTVVTFATADPDFSTLVTALTTSTPSTDFVSTLSGDGPFTVFAPTDDAFAAVDPLPGEEVLTQVLFHHVVAGNFRAGDLTMDGTTTLPTLTMEEDDIVITLPGTGDNIADITDGSGADDIGIIRVNVQASNGVIHAINKVMIPNLPN
ncbi:MAG: fasciclin domain-containing protein [Maribacter sp.]